MCYAVLIKHLVNQSVKTITKIQTTGKSLHGTVYCTFDYFYINTTSKSPGFYYSIVFQ